MTRGCEAMLEAEAALAAAQADEGVISREAAEAVAAACRESFEIGGRERGEPGRPARARAAGARPEAHKGATSQDILDTAAMLVARRARALILAELDGVVAALRAARRRAPRRRAMAGRTLMQQARPVTFGLKAAGWLSGVAAARDRALARRARGAARRARSAPARRVSSRASPSGSGSPAPAMPWHGDRTPRRPARRRAGRSSPARCEKVALDVVLLAQNEVGEVAESSEGGRGGSSAMPHKHNPVGASARGPPRGRCAAPSACCSRRWPASTSAPRARGRASGARCRRRSPAAGGAAWSLREALEGLTIDAERMAENLAARRPRPGHRQRAGRPRTGAR